MRLQAGIELGLQAGIELGENGSIYPRPKREAALAKEKERDRKPTPCKKSERRYSSSKAPSISVISSLSLTTAAGVMSISPLALFS